MSNDFRPDGDAPRYFGLYPAIVTNLVDQDGLGRIEVSFPWLGADGATVRAWATLLSPYADQDQGFQVLPERDTQVVVGFEAGSLRRPYIVGSAWNGKESLPVSPEKANNKRIIKTRSGSILEFDDTGGAVKVTLSTKSGHKLILKDSPQEVSLEHQNGCKITMNAAGQVKIDATSTVDITASVMNVHAPMALFDGTIKCTTLITTSVVSSSYTPGAGNIW
ncbi:phage baseplate assembly protein V [Candidatus Thiodictyon syntrophicum]|jgi:uncharacterized protein involved in type VI secretion and phage assembly|uniref:Gp5/Type VI secretion system Vgr protein OB-fold domain-containing protein n=1 Tax=Candidatus Thiodictyon syntrophicum TaxID=1166950 RepID=A0A2K8U9D0_9GAMM|nr:phage baseplate assembly protein V [Candidatus Thiodictyon syntrophicum]AUB82190.1 hypothetical protein THSYN_15360 [Candidatus Thiodictyon syntrophicum]